MPEDEFLACLFTAAPPVYRVQASGYRLRGSRSEYNAARGLMKPTMRRCNSSSSLFITSTVETPDEEHLLFTVANVVNRLLSNDLAACSSESAEFNPGGVRRAPENPLPTEIFAYIEGVQQRAEFSIECSVLMMIYLMRSSVDLTKDNWDLLVLCAFMVAQKFWDDTPLRSSDFLQLLDVGRSQHLSAAVLNSLEISFLKSLRFNLAVSRDTYTRTYFELQGILPRETQSKLTQPITAAEGAQLGLFMPTSPVAGPEHGLLTPQEKHAVEKELWLTMPDLDASCSGLSPRKRSTSIAVIS